MGWMAQVQWLSMDRDREAFFRDRRLAEVSHVWDTVLDRSRVRERESPHPILQTKFLNDKSK